MSWAFSSINFTACHSLPQQEGACSLEKWVLVSVRSYTPRLTHGTHPEIWDMRKRPQFPIGSQTGAMGMRLNQWALYFWDKSSKIIKIKERKIYCCLWFCFVVLLDFLLGEERRGKVTTGVCLQMYVLKYLHSCKNQSSMPSVPCSHSHLLAWLLLLLLRVSH